ncbi:uncharacterized protein LOC111113525 [Crassostrea virginica]
MGRNWNEYLLYLAGILLAAAYDDLSFQKDATQSRTYPGSRGMYGADNAVDGDISTCMRTDAIGKNSPYEYMWWKVDLGGVYTIYSVNILFKSYDGHEQRQRQRFAGFSLYISNDFDISSRCYIDGNQLPPLNFTTTCITFGRYVTFYNERLDGIPYFEGYNNYVTGTDYTELCEVIVYGCETSGVYGSKCDIPCPMNCKNDHCHIQNGTCFGCKPGWTGTYCNTQCDDGWYGMDCVQRCPDHCRDNSTCNHVTGTCDEGCSAGWKGSSCDTECEDGTYGEDCAIYCSGHCLNESACNKETGLCERGCDPGYMNSLCSDQCKNGWYGLDCIQQCSDHCRANGTCNHITGKCDDGCSAGWNGSTCNTACEDGTYGIDCANNCSHNCLNDSSCNKETGHCEKGCVPGYKGSFCEEICAIGYFGTNCQNACSEHCTNNTLCDHVNGFCIGGCKIGYEGDRCNKTCTEGFYGDNCSLNCFPNCKTCDHIDGTCSSCNAGWMGPNCSFACTWSYGEDCQFPCSRRCINQTCDRFNGTCISLCEIRNSGNCDQESEIGNPSSNWIVGFSLSLSFNIIVMIGVFIYLRRNQLKKTIYHVTNDTTREETVVPQAEDSTFYELPISGYDHIYQL